MQIIIVIEWVVLQMKITRTMRSVVSNRNSLGKLLATDKKVIINSKIIKFTGQDFSSKVNLSLGLKTSCGGNETLNYLLLETKWACRTRIDRISVNLNVPV